MIVLLLLVELAGTLAHSKAAPLPAVRSWSLTV